MSIDVDTPPGGGIVGVPSNLRINPATGLPAVAQYVSIIGQPPGVVINTTWAVGNFGVIYDGVFGVTLVSATGYCPFPPGSNIGGTFFVTDLGGVASITPYNEQGVALTPVITLPVAGFLEVSVSQQNIRAPLPPYIDRPGAFGPQQFPVFGLLRTSTYRITLTIGAATQQDGNDFAYLGLQELR